jgi:hypothetical protein
VKSAKRKRQYEHIKESARKRGGRSARRAEEIAARTVNKQRRQTGETKGGRKSSRRKSSSRKSSSRKSSSISGRRRSRR